MATVRRGELKGEDFKNHNLAEDCTKFDILLAVVERASSLYDEAKKKEKDSEPNSRKISSAEKKCCLERRKDDVFCFKAISRPKNRRDFEVLPIKKRPLPVEDINNDEVKSKKKMKQPRDLGMIDYISPIEILLHEPFDHQLPIEFKESLTRLNQGLTIEKEILVIQKALTATDISPHQNRFSIPLNRVMNSFLNDDEIKILESREENCKLKKLEVNLIDPMRMKRAVKLGRWVMNKDSKKKEKKASVTNNESENRKEGGGGGGVSISYVINGPWAQIVDFNKLKEGDVMQLWGVRVQGSLWLLLVKLQN